MTFLRSFLAAVACFFIMFAGSLMYEVTWPEDNNRYYGSSSGSDFEFTKKNYASGKSYTLKEAVLSEPAANMAGSEKYEKIASMSQTTLAFERDSKALQEQINLSEGVTQYESASGLRGNRRLDLGIGVPPEKFDTFLESAQKIGTLTHLSVIKHDKTSEYQKLRAERATLEQARNAVAEMRNLNASVDERLRLEERYNEIESKIQNLGVSLGDFDSQNEFYTVKLSMREVIEKKTPSFTRQVWRSLIWTMKYYFYLSIGLFACAATIFIGALLLKGLMNLLRLGSKKIEG